MQSKKPILKFLLTAALVYGFFAIPSSWIDKGYGNFYRATGKYFFSHFAGKGFSLFSPMHESKITRIYVGNNELINSDGSMEINGSEFNTRNFGYLPTLLLISLIISSPVPVKRKLFAAIGGFIIIMGWILLRQWIQILEIIAQNPWLKLYTFSETLRNFISFLYHAIVVSVSPSLTFAVIVWLLVTFRKEDLSLIRSKGKS